MGKPWTHVAGTEGTGEYLAVARAGELGNKLAVRLLPSGSVRVRVEPRSTEDAAAMAEVLSGSAGWKQPGDSGQNRFSTVAGTPEQAEEAVDAALKALKATGRSVQYNPDRGHWRKLVKQHTA